MKKSVFIIIDVYKKGRKNKFQAVSTTVQIYWKAVISEKTIKEERTKKKV